MQPRFVVFVAAVGLLLAALAAPSWAGPSDAGSSNTGEAGALPRSDPTPRSFGFMGPKPVDRRSPTGITRPTPAPCLDVVDHPGFGGGCSDGTCKIQCSDDVCVVDGTDCETKTATGEQSIGGRRMQALCDPCNTCDPCAPRPVYCPPGCGPCPTTRRISTEPLSIPAAYWSSGYHDGAACQTTCDFGYRCDPCRPVVCQPTCAPAVCDPCAPRRVVVRRACPPTPCAEPCVTTCAPPRRRVVVRRVYAPACGPCDPCGPRWGGGAPCGPAWGGYGPRYGGYGPRYGSCGPRWGGGCGPYGVLPAVAAVGVGVGLAALTCGFGCW